MAAVKFDGSRARKVLGDERIENTEKGLAAAFRCILVDQEFEVNDIEMLRWCEYQFNRRYKTLVNRDNIPKTLSPVYVIQQFHTYMRNWYETHCKWLRSNGK